MRKLFLVTLISLLFFSLIFLIGNIKSVANQEGNALQKEYVPNEVLVKFKKDVLKYYNQEVINSIISVQGKIITYLGKEISPFVWDRADLSLRSFRLDPDLFHIKVPETIGTEQAIYILNQNPNVEYAEKNGIYHVFEKPTDPDYEEHQWALGESTIDADIDAPEAWDIFTGSSDIVVALIDSGANYNHDDIEANIWINEGEIPGNDIDDDNNGYKDDVHGYDFVSGDGDPMDDLGHGTHIAGIVGAEANNGEGIAGVNWNVKIMLLKIIKFNNEIKASDAIAAIDYATENGAHLSTNSWGDDDDFYSTGFAIRRAMDAGKLFIAAAGNYQNFPWYDNDIDPIYPASIDLDNIISVASTNILDHLAGHSHYGLHSVDLGAPGKDIYSTLMYGNYGNKSGTSMAAPHVAGVAALVLGDRPNLDWWQVKTIIMSRGV